MHWIQRVSPEDSGQRLDQFWTQKLHDLGVSRARIQRWVRSGSATVDEEICQRPAQTVYEGQVLGLKGKEPATKVQPKAGNVEVVFQERDFLVVNKPPGLTVHPAPGHKDPTLVQYLVHNYPQMGSMEGERPGIVHRLDKDTSGLVVVAKNEKTRLHIARQFSRRRVDKEYLAVVHGCPKNTLGTLDKPIGRHPTKKTQMAVVDKGGREALTQYRVVWTNEDRSMSLLRVKIHTGRTHQIRVHLSHMGHPVMGDNVYGGRVKENNNFSSKTLAALASRQMLHAWRLRFFHPTRSEPLYFCQPPPKDFLRVLLQGDRRCQKIGLTGLPCSGKSTLLGELERLGNPTWEADKAVSNLYMPDGNGWFALKNRYGHRFVPDEKSPVDKQKLFKEMTENPRLRREVEETIHPLVLHDLTRFFQKHENNRCCFAEVPLLVEKEWHNRKTNIFDLVVCLFIPPAVREQLATGRGCTQSVLAMLDSWQFSQEDKIKGCHLVIENTGSRKDLLKKALSLTRVLKSIRQHRAKSLVVFLNGVWSAK